jgi:hypothetical protein
MLSLVAEARRNERSGSTTDSTRTVATVMRVVNMTK